MACINFLSSQGLKVSARGSRIVISPKSQVTSEVKDYVKKNRLNILAELAANDGKERRTHWRVKLPGVKSFPMIGQPMTQEEALRTAIGIWPEAKLEQSKAPRHKKLTRCADD